VGLAGSELDVGVDDMTAKGHDRTDIVDIVIHL
jgi:hypothetical protein